MRLGWSSDGKRGRDGKRKGNGTGIRFARSPPQLCCAPRLRRRRDGGGRRAVEGIRRRGGRPAGQVCYKRTPCCRPPARLPAGKMGHCRLQNSFRSRVPRRGTGAPGPSARALARYFSVYSWLQLRSLGGHQCSPIHREHVHACNENSRFVCC